MKKNITILIIFFSLFFTDMYSCTSVIISGRLTKDGRPLMWKHRDTGEENNRVAYFTGKRYSFIGLVNSPDSSGVVWIGTNSAGFSIMNTASYNLKNDNIQEMDMEGVLMYNALSECSSVDEFEKYLKNLKRPMRVEANFGVMDAQGNAAYFEVNNTTYIKNDANDPKVAPEGYLLYTNFSHTGRANEGMGYVRFTTANTILSRAVATNKKITPAWIFDNLSRSFYNSVLDLDLVKEVNNSAFNAGWFIDQDFIPRKSSSASVVIEGVNRGEDPRGIIMWTVLGYPPAGVAVPLFLTDKDRLPNSVKNSTKSKNSILCDIAIKLKRESFPIKRGNGSKYLFFAKVFNKNGNGYMQLLKEYELKIDQLYAPYIKDCRAGLINYESLNNINRSFDSFIESEFAPLFNL